MLKQVETLNLEQRNRRHHLNQAHHASQSALVDFMKTPSAETHRALVMARKQELKALTEWDRAMGELNRYLMQLAGIARLN